MSVLLVLLVLLFSLASPTARAQVDSNVPQCRGAFDFYFVLDSSGSVGGKFQTEVVPFVKNVSVNFVNPSFRLSFITFATDGLAILNLTSNREMIGEGIERLQMHAAGGGTNLATGLSKVNSQIDNLGGDTASVILILTDGEIGDQTNANNEALKIRQSGGSIFAIGIANANRQQLLDLVRSEKELFIGSDFQYLTTIINQVVNDTCIEILDADPTQLCTNEGGLMATLTGQGFTNTLSPNATACRLIYNETQFEITKPVGTVQYDKLVCSLPNFDVSQDILLQVTLNGISFISSNVTISVRDCVPTPARSVNAALATGLTLSLLILLILLILLALWFFLPLITHKKNNSPKKADPEQPQAPSSRQKWATVDASYYGGRGTGGISPMKVDWGDMGATIEGSKLTAAKGAKEVNVMYTISQNNSSHQSKELPWFERIWKKIREWIAKFYFIISSMRPIRAPEGNILWCPYRMIKQGKYATSSPPVEPIHSSPNSADKLTRAATIIGNSTTSEESTRPPPPRPPPAAHLRSNTLPARPPPRPATKPGENT